MEGIERKRKLAGIILLLALFNGCERDYNTGTGEIIGVDSNTGEYKLVWEEDFGGTALDTDTWNYETGYGSNGWGNDEWQEYTSDVGNVRVEDSNLVITAKAEDGYTIGKRNGSITSARITTAGKVNFKYGLIRARIKVPDGKTMWPAFWMLGESISSVGWPACGEIDILEMFNKDTSPTDNYTAHSALHWDDSGHKYTTSHYSMGEKLSDDYHIYQVEWTAGRIVTSIDENEIYRSSITDSSKIEFHKNFYFIINLAVGGNPIGLTPQDRAFPQSMYVDWIKVYQKQGE